MAEVNAPVAGQRPGLAARFKRREARAPSLTQPTHPSTTPTTTGSLASQAIASVISSVACASEVHQEGSRGATSEVGTERTICWRLSPPTHLRKTRTSFPTSVKRLKGEECFIPDHKNLAQESYWQQSLLHTTTVRDTGPPALLNHLTRFINVW